MKLLILILAGFLAADFHAAAQPSWIATNGAETGFSPASYLTGYGISSVDGQTAEAVQNAKEQALKDLSGKLKTRVEATSQLTETEAGKANFSTYQSDVKTMVSLDLGGIERYEVGYDPGLRRQVALAVMDTEKMRNFLSVDRAGVLAELDTDLETVRALVARDRPDLLQPALTTFDLHLEGLAQNVAVGRLLGDNIDPEATVQRFYEARGEIQEKLLQNKILTEKDLVKALVKAFPWADLTGKSVILTNAVYKTSDISGQFFSYLRDDLEDALGLVAPGLKVLQDQPDARPTFIFLGTYQEEGAGGYNLKFKLQDASKNRLVAPVFEVSLDAGFVKNQKMEFVPANLQAAASDHDLQMGVFRQTVKTDLRVKASVGESGMTAPEGTKFYFWVWVNRPGYINMIYSLAGEEHLRVPLLTNYFIPPSQIAQWVRLDQEFEVTPPFGTESAQFFFSVNQVAEYQTVKTVVGGQEYSVLEGDYGKLLVTTRGLIKSDKSSDADQLRTDRTFTLTTVPAR